MNTTDLPPINRKAFDNGKPQTTLERVNWMLTYCLTCNPEKGTFVPKCSNVYIRADSALTGLYVDFKQAGAPFGVSVLASKIVLCFSGFMPPYDRCPVTHINGNRMNCKISNIKWANLCVEKIKSESDVTRYRAKSGDGYKVDTGKRDEYGKPVYRRFSDAKHGGVEESKEAALKFSKETASANKSTV